MKIILILFLSLFICNIYANRGKSERNRTKILQQKEVEKNKKENSDSIPSEKNPNNRISSAGIYTGIVTPLVVQTIASGTDANYFGIVKKVALEGDIIRPEVTDMEGKVIQEGTVIIQQGTKYWRAKLDNSLYFLEAAKQEYITAKEIYERYRTLSPAGATSIQKFQEYRANYYDKKAKCKKAEALVIENQQVLDSCTQIAPFEGIVTKVLFVKGKAAGNPATIEITQLNPICVKVKMSRQEANQINSETAVSIYSPDGKSIHGVFNGASVLLDDGILLITHNNIQKAKGVHNNIKKILDCFLCWPFLSR